MSKTIIRSARIWDGSGSPSFIGDVMLGDQRIVAVSHSPGKLRTEDAEQIDATGLTLMPGLVEGHAHLSFGFAKT